MYSFSHNDLVSARKDLAMTLLNINVQAFSKSQLKKFFGDGWDDNYQALSFVFELFFVADIIAVENFHSHTYFVKNSDKLLELRGM